MAKVILVIDDDDILRDTLASGLRQSGFDTVSATDAKEGDQILKRISVDAVVLDRMMPDMDGLTFLQNLRMRGNSVPVIMLTAMSGTENTIDGLRIGADDYMTKPFKLQELILRLNNITKRQTAPGTVSDDFGLFFDNNEFFINDPANGKKLFPLSQTEKKLLHNLITPVGNIVPATPMVAKRLRNKIKDVLSNIDIITVRGMGYKIIKTNG